MDKIIKDILDFYRVAEKLKTTTRHSWTSNPQRQESTAEHSWMFGLLAIIIVDQLKIKIDLHKVLKMAIVHDLAEAVTGDIPIHEVSRRQDKKHQTEKKVFIALGKKLPKRVAQELLKLWEEFEAHKTPEAKLANALDRLEAAMQHNLSDISTWDQSDFDIQPYFKNEYFDFDPFIRAFKDIVDIHSMKKIITAKQHHRIDKKHLEKYHADRKQKHKRR